MDSDQQNKTGIDLDDIETQQLSQVVFIQAVIVYSITYLINILVLIVFTRIRQLKHRMYYLMALNVTDVLNNTYCFQAVIIHYAQLTIDDSFCQRYGAVFAVGFQQSLNLHTWMSLDQCLAVLCPNRYRSFSSNQRRAKNVAVIVIIAGFLMILCYNLTLSQLELIRFHFEPHFAGCYIERRI